MIARISEEDPLCCPCNDWHSVSIDIAIIISTDNQNCKLMPDFHMPNNIITDYSGPLFETCAISFGSNLRRLSGVIQQSETRALFLLSSPLT